MMPPILQSRLPFAPWMDPRTARLPGILPAAPEDWLRVDDAFAGQMAERDARIRDQLPLVHGLLPGAVPAAAELLEKVLARLAQTEGYHIGAAAVRRPDGISVPIDRAQPLVTAGRLVQEDLCLLERMGDEHLLTGAILCFPASWTLSQKLGQPMTRIHVPVDHYTDDLARRVQRLFDAIRPDQVLCRMNALVYEDAALFQPRREGEPRPHPEQRLYMRSERQCLLRLPESRAVLFSIHTYLVRLEDLAPEDRAGLEAAGL